MIDYNLLLIQNPWWTAKEAIEDDPKIKEFNASSVKYLPQSILELKLENGAVNIVFGPRQTGKSTAIKLLLRRLLKKDIPAEHILYFNCDAIKERQELIELVLSFFEGIKNADGQTAENYLFLDEISSVEDWPYAVKWLADAGLLVNSKMILTGSSSISLKKSGEFLPGRRKGGKDISFLPIDFYAYFRLLHPQFPLTTLLGSIDELEKMQRLLAKEGINIGKVYQNFLLTGGFLKMINLMVQRGSYADTVELYQSTIKSELAKFGKKDIHARQILRKIINSLTSETSYTNVAEEAELGSKNTAFEYLSFFCDSFLLTETLFYNIAQKRLIIKKNKKYYPTDPFLLWIFSSLVWGTNQIETFYQKYLTSPLDAQLAEVFVASQLYKRGATFHFFKNRKELDFYLPNQDLGIEVKYKEKITSTDTAGLALAKRKVLVSKNILGERRDILLIPISLFGFLDWTRV